MHVTVDGSIGSGKTTLLTALNKDHGYEIDLEPVDSWEPYLREMYHHGKAVFEFQVRVWLDRCWPAPPTNPNYPTLIERSPLFQREVFTRLNLENGKLTEREVGNLKQMYDKVLNIWKPILYIYLRTDPVACARRILNRARESEDDIPLAYLKRLHELHETTYNKVIGPKVAIDVEGKTVEAIVAEVHAAIKLAVVA